jgi:hypothetical protein
MRADLPKLAPYLDILRNQSPTTINGGGTSIAPPALPLSVGGDSTPTPTPQTLKLYLSEDAYKGDAQFTAKIDGKTLFGPTSVSTPHSSGMSQAFSYSGNLTAGVHDLEIDFINDRWAGTASTDRNLYVDQVTYGGKNYLSHSTPMYSNGALHIAIGNQ